MKTVSQSFLDNQKKADASGVRRVLVKRRYWDGTNFVWEDEWKELDKNLIISYSPVTWQLDSDQQNEFKVSNVTLRVDNSTNIFRADNEADGLFRQDETSPFYGYELFWTKFQLVAGYVLEDGSEEYVPIFTGLLTNINQDSTNMQASLELEGLEATLVNTRAEDITTPVTNESLGVGDNTTTVFTTLNPGVGLVTSVRVGGITKIEGADYSISNLDDSTLGATVTFTVAPGAGQAITCDYYFWPQSLEFHELVELLVTAGGVNSADQDIQPVQFSNGVINTFGFDTKADFDAGTFDQAQSSDFSGLVGIDIAANPRETRTWGESLDGWEYGKLPASSFGIIVPGMGDTSLPPGASVTTDGTRVSIAASGGGQNLFLKRDNLQTLGSFKFTFQFAGIGLTNTSFGFFPFGQGKSFDGAIEGLQIKVKSNQIQILTSSFGQPIQVFNTSPGTTEHEIVVTRTLTQILVSYDSNQIFAIPNFRTVEPPEMEFILYAAGAHSVYLRHFEVPPATLTGSWESAAIDFGSTPSAWGEFNWNYLSLSPTLFTKTSANNITYDSYLEVESTTPISPLRRYAKVKAEFSLSSSTPEDPQTYPGIGQILFSVPLLDSVVVRTSTGAVGVVMPAFDGVDAWSAIEKIGQFTNYEFGFNPDETFFFRPRGSKNPSLSISEKDFVSKVTGLVNGYDKVYGVVRATYGNFTKEVSDPTANILNPTKRVSSARYEIQGDSGVQIPASADIATGMAKSLYQYYSRPRRRCLLLTKFLPQLDLSDVIVVSLTNNWPAKPWYLGDDQVDLGDPNFHLWGDGQQILSNFEAKIISARYDLDRFTTEFTLEEAI